MIILISAMNYFSRLYLCTCCRLSPRPCRGRTILVERSCSSVAPTKHIRKILIANRGEIACRVIRTAKRLGIRTVAVYSNVDAQSMHVAMADEAYNIGAASAQESYLRGDKLLYVAERTAADAIHPGYGFLSESAEFAEACLAAKVTFIGPPPSAIRDMGIKSKSKVIMAAAGVPVIEGYHGEDQSDSTLIQQAERIGFPIMIKAVRGGGGKGMRIAEGTVDFVAQLESARREALKAFGDDAVLLERCVHSPRHVEVQVFADHHGNCVHLMERDCSVQRRHQKVIEEAPAPGLSEELQCKLGAAGVRAARAVNYVGAGTVEFILDRQSHAFHFMEMNTRLQVEHPVTEMITGTDLVEWQIRVASGECLPLSQVDIRRHGHAVEARIYAEEPGAGFLPGAGPLVYLRTPQPGLEVRIETGVREGDEVTVHYDPMIAKLIVWAPDRTQALAKLKHNLANYHIVGVETNIAFLRALCDNCDLIAGDVHTGFIEQHQDVLLVPTPPSRFQLFQGALTVVLHDELVSTMRAHRSPDPYNPFATETGFRLNHLLMRTILLKQAGTEYLVEVVYEGPDTFTLSLADSSGERCPVVAHLERDLEGDTLRLRTEMEGVVVTATVLVRPTDVHVFNTETGGVSFALAQVIETGEATTETGLGAVSPMPGVVDRVVVRPGDRVKQGDPLIVVIAMKMEYVIKSPRDGVIETVLCQPGQNVAKNVQLVRWAMGDQ